MQLRTLAAYAAILCFLTACQDGPGPASRLRFAPITNFESVTTPIPLVRHPFTGEVRFAEMVFVSSGVVQPFAPGDRFSVGSLSGFQQQVTVRSSGAGPGVAYVDSLPGVVTATYTVLPTGETRDVRFDGPRSAALQATGALARLKPLGAGLPDRPDGARNGDVLDPAATAALVERWLALVPESDDVTARNLGNVRARVVGRAMYSGRQVFALELLGLERVTVSGA